MRKGDVVVGERKVVLGNLLEPQDDGAGGGMGPPAGGDEGRASSLVLGVVEDALEVGVGGGALDGDGVAGLDERADDGGGKGAVLEGLLLRSEEDCRISRHVGGCSCCFCSHGVRGRTTSGWDLGGAWAVTGGCVEGVGGWRGTARRSSMQTQQTDGRGDVHVESESQWLG